MKKKAIITFLSNHFHEISSFVLPRFESYAKKCNADLIVVENFHSPESHIDFEKQVFVGDNIFMQRFKKYKDFAKYERSLFIDMDFLVREDTPDIFKIVPPDKMSMLNIGGKYFYNTFSDGQMYADFTRINTPVLQKTYQCLYELNNAWNFGVTLPSEIGFGFNIPFNHYQAGLILFNKENIKLFTIDDSYNCKDPKVDGIPSLDEVLINLIIRKYNINVYGMPSCFHTPYSLRTSDYLDCNYMIHYAGLHKENRIAVMKSDDELLKSRDL